MAARTRKGTKDNPWSDETRQKIQASMLINSLTSHVLEGTKMEATQVRAAEILLKKTLPDLQSTEISSPEGAPVFAVTITEKQE